MPALAVANVGGHARRTAERRSPAMRAAGGTSGRARTAAVALLAVAAVAGLAATAPGHRPGPPASHPSARLDITPEPADGTGGAAGEGTGGGAAGENTGGGGASPSGVHAHGDGRHRHPRGSSAGPAAGPAAAAAQPDTTPPTGGGSATGAPSTSRSTTSSSPSSTPAGAVVATGPAVTTAATSSAPGPCAPWQLQVTTTTSASAYGPGQPVTATSVVTQVAGPACQFDLQAGDGLPCGVELVFGDPSGQQQYWPWPGEQVPCPATGPVVLSPGDTDTATQTWAQQAMGADGQPTAVPPGTYTATGAWAWDDGTGTPAELAAQSAPFTIG